MRDFDNYAEVEVFTLEEERPVRPAAIHRDYMLRELQEFVQGNIEVVHLKNFKDGEDYLLVINEEGLLDGLPLNRAAFIVTQVRCVGRAVLMKAKDLD